MPGDSILFQRGNSWREQLKPHSGSPEGYIRYGAYGSGKKPQLLGSVDKSMTADWQHGNGFIWVTNIQTRDVGNIIFDQGRICGVKKWRKNDLHQQGDYFFDTKHKLLTLYSEHNPGQYYKNIECALREHIINQGNSSYVKYENLAVQYGAAHGFGGGNTHHIIIRNCDVSFIGGGAQYNENNKKSRVRYGNGIEFWGNAHDNLVEESRIWEIYDAALSNQNNRPNVQQYNITYRNNTIWKAEYSFEYWNRPENSTTRNILFEHNTCLNAGYGWGHNQRPDPSGRHLCFYSSPASIKEFKINNNIFYEATGNIFYTVFWKQSALNALKMNYNCWYQRNGVMINFRSHDDVEYTMKDFPHYQAEWNKEKNSTTAKPMFIAPELYDFRQQLSSPCFNSGIIGQ